MFIKNLFSQKPVPVEYIVALTVTQTSIAAAVFSLSQQKSQILGTASKNFSGDWHNLVEEADEIISKAAGEINLDKIKKIVFGFPPSFLEKDKIAKNKIPYLKKLTSELELTPSGFVVIPEAINFYLEKKENSLQTGLFLGLTSQELTLTLFRSGKLTDQMISQRSQSIQKDIQAALAELTDVEIFPSRILLYGQDDNEDLEVIKEELLKYPWQQNSKFLHFPKIEVLPADFYLKAVVEAAVSELSQSLEMPESAKTTSTESLVATQEEKVSPTQLGFQQQEITPEKAKKRIVLPKLNFSFNFLKNIFKIPIGHKFYFSLGLLVLLLLVLGAVYFFFTYTLVKAKLTLIVDPQVFEQEKEVSLNPEITTPSIVDNEIPAKFLIVEVSANKTIPTTGKKIVGDKASGVVTVYNKTTSSRVFAKGTKITAKNLTFTFDEQVEIPAASEALEGLTYGKAQVRVTAGKIGPEGNLPAQTEFTIEDFSTASYIGRNEEAFSGGTSREVSSVVAKDQENLLTQLKAELKEAAQKELLAKLTEGEKLLEELIEGEVVERKFSTEVDQEAKELSLNLTMKYQGVTYQEKDFVTLLEKVIMTNLPQGYEFKPAQTKISVLETKTTGKTVRFKANLNAWLIPQIETDKLKKDLTGMSVKQLDNYLRQIPKVAGYEVNLTAPFSFLKANLPKTEKNIIIEIKTR